MAWVRYDDQFPINPKVTAVVVEDPGALSLHVLANTWSNTTKAPGYVPAHQPAILLCDRSLAEKWSDLLVRAGLWHVRGQECGDCKVEYAGLSKSQANSGGWVFHNAKTYQAPARDRTTPGTSADLSEKRRAAGRKGGHASAVKRSGQASEASGVSKISKCSSNSVSPDPDPDPVPEPKVPEVQNPPATAVAIGEQASLDGMPADPSPPERQYSAEDHAFAVARWRLDERKKAGAPVIGGGRKGPLYALKNVLVEAFEADYTEDEVKQVLGRITDGIPSKQMLDRALTTLRYEQNNIQPPQNGGLNGYQRGPHKTFKNPTKPGAYEGVL